MREVSETVDVRCPACRQKYRVTMDKLGRKTKCQCGAVVALGNEVVPVRTAPPKPQSSMPVAAKAVSADPVAEETPVPDAIVVARRTVPPGKHCKYCGRSDGNVVENPRVQRTAVILVSIVAVAYLVGLVFQWYTEANYIRAFGETMESLDRMADPRRR